MISPTLLAARETPARRGDVSLRWAGWLTFAVVCLWFGVLGHRHLVPSDEGRYAEIAREMFASGDWLTIRYNALKYFEKPPFQLWMTAIAYHAFGVGDWQARLWVALSGAAGLLATAGAARRWFGPRAGLLTGLVLLAAPTWNLGGHFNSLDMGVSGALACVLAALLMAQHPDASPGQRRGWMWATWGAMGVAVLTKGLIGIVLPGLALCGYTLLARDWALWRRLHLVSGAALMLAITAPWFVWVSLRNPEFPQFFFIHEHWQRYTSAVHQRSAPVWYFVPQLIGGFLPWLGLLPGIGARVWRDAWNGTGGAGGFEPAVLLAAWAGSILLFFSLSGSKLPGYILPVYPALALLAALVLERIDAPRWQRQVVAMGVLSVVGMLASALLAVRASEASLQAYAPWLGVACALIAVGMLISGWLNRAGRLLPGIAAFALAWFAGTSVGLLGHETIGRSSSGVDLAARIESVLTPAMPIYSVNRLDHTLPFYLRRTMTLVADADELAFGTAREPAKWLPTVAAFRAVWVAGPQAVAVMTPATFATLRAAGLPMVPLAEDARRVAVTRLPVVPSLPPVPGLSELPR